MATGGMARSNGSEAMFFDSEVASVHVVLLHRPMGPHPAEPRHGAEPHPAAFDSHAYFEGKKRLWEVRIQCTFKKAMPPHSMRIATQPFERQPLGQAGVQLHRWLVKMAGPAMRGIHHSPGDDPRGRAESDVEQPMVSIPLVECDQYIPEAPPSLVDASFPKLGLTKARDPQAFRRNMAQVTFEAGETHTFGFWGPSRAVDLLGWQVASIPMFQGVSLDTVNGKPPLYLTVYSLSPGEERDRRHLPSRMQVLLKAAVWSSLYPPSPRRMDELRSLASPEGTPTRAERRRTESCMHIPTTPDCVPAVQLRRSHGRPEPGCACGVWRLFSGRRG